MSSYRVYLRDPRGIVARHDLDAADDSSALWIAAQLCEACSDVCETFEVWAGVRRLDRPGAPPPAADEIRDRAQEQLMQVEEILQQSRWAVADSERLLTRLNYLRSTRGVREPQLC